MASDSAAGDDDGHSADRRPARSPVLPAADRLDPPTVVAAGFLLSAVAHGAEWLLFDAGRWVVVVIYLHLAAASGLLLSGFWSLVDERFDPASARGSFGRIAAAGTAGGVLGSVVSERTASMLQPVTVLMLLAALHVLCGIGVLWIGQTPGLLSRRDSDTRAGTTSGVRTVLSTPYLRVIAGIVVCTTAASAILDYMLKSEAAHALGTGPQLLRFFTAFYAVVQVLSFLAQTSMHAAMGRLGISGTISALPAAVGTAGLAAMLTGSWPMVSCSAASTQCSAGPSSAADMSCCSCRWTLAIGVGSRQWSTSHATARGGRRRRHRAGAHLGRRLGGRFAAGDRRDAGRGRRPGSPGGSSASTSAWSSRSCSNVVILRRSRWCSEAGLDHAEAGGTSAGPERGGRGARRVRVGTAPA